MVKFFNKKKKKGPISRKKEVVPAAYRSKGPLVDPIIYSGDLDEKEYPILEREVERKPQEEAENPLNKR